MPSYGTIPELPHVAKLFWASERERMIQGRQSRRNIDSNAHPPRFICFKIQFHRPFSATFATQSATNGHSMGRLEGSVHPPPAEAVLLGRMKRGSSQIMT